MEEDKFKMMVFRIKKMSSDGFKRLSNSLKMNYQKNVYKPIKRVIIDKNKIYDEKTLAYFLILNFGVGEFEARGFSRNTGKFNYQLFRVSIYGNLDSKWGYEFEHTRGISRYGFWEGR